MKAGISTTVLMAAAEAVQAMLKPPMQMHEILHRHMESLLSEQRVNIARALRLQIDQEMISKEQLLTLATGIERGFEVTEWTKDAMLAERERK